ncbi:MAG: diacylglycerol kinase family protein [Clostridia bacterium]|nr:diacylglycerol kinase family protein [Clostridia bacterium]
MKKAYIVYNPLAGNGKCEESVKKLAKMLTDEAVYWSITDGKTYTELRDTLDTEDYVILCGGDGTLNRFINDIGDVKIDNDILYYPGGSGNDFAHDIGITADDTPVSIKKYLCDLPEVEVNGNTYKFINGVGYGIDGYCCEVGDKLRAQSAEKIDYTSIAIKGLLFHYKPTDAKVTVDGKTYRFKKVWIAPTMNGRFYGGGMMPTPAQDRLSEDKRLSVMIFHGTGKLHTLMIFPSLFKGEHIKHKKHVKVLEGQSITVEFDSPRALQVDGETILGVTSYTARAKVPARV